MWTQLEPATERVVDISDPDNIKILDSLPEVPGHSMNWWKTADGREFTISANEQVGSTEDTCQPYPRPTGLGNAAEAYVTEVTGDKLKHATLVTLAINRPERTAPPRRRQARAPQSPSTRSTTRARRTSR